MSYIYLDHAATTPVSPEVLEAMLPYFTEYYGNPSSLHAIGRAARSALHRARDAMAARLGCGAGDLVFTGSGTESDNMAVFGAAAAYRAKVANGSGRGHVITSQIEHQAVLHACRQLEAEGFEVTYLPVDTTGRVQLEDVAAALKPQTFLVSLMMGNNEVGTLQPVREIGQWLRDRPQRIWFHVDAVQALGSVELQLERLPVDMMSFSAHKLNGPKGVGALYISRRVSAWTPLIVGGAQERNRRAGTENVAGIVGFAKALELAAARWPEKQLHLERLRQGMIEALQSGLGESGFVVNGHPTERLAHILNVSFPGIDTETMLMNLDLAGIAAASGSACTSGALEVSHVLQAMHLPDEVTRSAVRFSFGPSNTMAEVEAVAREIATISARIRNRN